MGERNMIIDDDPGVLRMIRNTLGDRNYEITVWQDADQALQDLDQNAVDLVITDIIMPRMEGIEFIRAAKAKQPNLKIIAISGGGHFNAADYLAFARELGANAILPKPFRCDELVSLVRNQLAAA